MIRRRGFTLIELLIALVVFAVAGIAVSSRLGTTTSQIFQLERKTLASWVADNHLTRLRLERYGATGPIPTGRKTTRVRLGDWDWRLETEIEATTVETLRRVDVVVYVRGEDASVHRVTGFLGQH